MAGNAWIAQNAYHEFREVASLRASYLANQAAAVLNLRRSETELKIMSDRMTRLYDDLCENELARDQVAELAEVERGGRDALQLSSGYIVEAIRGRELLIETERRVSLLIAALAVWNAVWLVALVVFRADYRSWT